VTEWMVSIDTPHGVAYDEEVLRAFVDAIDGLRGVTGTGTSMNTRTGVLSASLSVETEDVQRGVDQAVSLFNAALERVGLAGAGIAHVEAEVLEEHAPIPA
jgi:hypothetical protein